MSVPRTVRVRYSGRTWTVRMPSERWLRAAWSRPLDPADAGEERVTFREFWRGYALLQAMKMSDPGGDIRL